MPSFQSVFYELLSVLLNWWNQDRIRISASEGRLLRLQCGDRLLIDTRICIVERRHTESLNRENPCRENPCGENSCFENSSGDKCVNYTLRFDDEYAELRVNLADKTGRPLCLKSQSSADMQWLSDDKVTLLSSVPSCFQESTWSPIPPIFSDARSPTLNQSSAVRVESSRDVPV
ncbi:MAG: hypothetical protein JNL58_22745 [Planctomyces sp.]|nr:hypothetical protein [Planctomyces sp.]